MKTSFGRDTGLQVRMLVTLLLLGLVYVVFVGVLFAAGASGVTILLVCGGLLAFQFFASDKLALRAMGANEVSPQEAPEFHAMIERLCVQADIPKPRVAIVPTPMPNAFAMGRSPKAATGAATPTATTRTGRASWPSSWSPRSCGSSASSSCRRCRATASSPQIAA